MEEGKSYNTNETVQLVPFGSNDSNGTEWIAQVEGQTVLSAIHYLSFGVVHDTNKIQEQL